MPDFPPELVAETRARIQNELQAKRNQIERNIEELDAAQQTSRQQAIQRSARLGGQAKASRREDEKFPPPSRFGQFPSDVVEQTSGGSGASHVYKERQSRMILRSSTQHSNHPVNRQ